MRERVKEVVDFSATNPKAKARVKSEFAREADINFIVGRYKRQGAFSDEFVTKKKPFFGDYSNVTDFRDLVDTVAKVQRTFNELPVDTKKKFKQDPSLALAFMADEANADEARKLGLLPPLTLEELRAKEAVEPVGETVAPSGA